MPIVPSPAVARAAEMLQLLSRRPTDAFNVSELARALDLPRATCDSIAQALAQSGLVVRRNDLRYALGPAAIALGDAARTANPLLQVASDSAEQLAREIGACTAVSLRRGDSSTVAAVFDHGPTFGVRAQVGQTIAHLPPFGAAYVAWHDDERAAWLARSAVPLRPADRRRLEAALAQVRRLGFSATVASPRRDELEAALSTLASRPGAPHARRTRDEVATDMVRREYLVGDLDADTRQRITLISAPVFDRGGRASASILLLGPDHALKGAEILRLGRRVVDAATHVTRLTGGALPATHPRDEG